MAIYKKFGATLSGGNEFVRVLVSASTESSDQYKDGDGNTIADQVDIAADKVPANAANGTRYQDQYRDNKAYTKQSVMTKAFINVTEDQELRLSYTRNDSTAVLYGNSKMDAAYDDSNIYSVEYNIENVSDAYKDINLQYYYSDVDHPMDTRFRISGKMNYKTNHLKTTMQGLKLKNNFDLMGHKLLVGLDGSKRTWEGESYMTNATSGVEGTHATSLTHTETKNQAIFAKLQKGFGSLNVELGARYDSTEINPYRSFR